MRRGLTLIELVGALPILVIVAVLLSRLFPVLLRDMPRMQRTVQTHNTVRSVLHQLRRDVEAAEALPDWHRGKNAGEETLIVRHPASMVTYRMTDKEIVRRRRPHGRSTPTTVTHTWPREKAEIRFRCWMAGDKTYAVEVRSSVRATKHGNTLYKLATAEVLFPGALPGRWEKP